MATKSNNAKSRYVPGSSRGPRSVTTLLAQMADLARGERIKGLRDDRHLSQPAVVDLLEKKAGARVVTLRGYQAWEAGGGIKWENVKVLAEMHGVAPEWIMSGDEAHPETPDLMSELDGDRLARIEQRLSQLEIAVEHQNANLDRQSAILERIEDIVSGIPTPEEIAAEAEELAREHAAERAKAAGRKPATGS